MAFLVGWRSDPDPYVRGACWMHVEYLCRQADPGLLKQKMAGKNEDERVAAFIAAGWRHSLTTKQKDVLTPFLKDPYGRAPLCGRALAMQLDYPDSLGSFVSADADARDGMGAGWSLNMRINKATAQAWRELHARSPDLDVAVLAAVDLLSDDDLIKATRSPVSLVRLNAADALLRRDRQTAHAALRRSA